MTSPQIISSWRRYFAGASGSQPPFSIRGPTASIFALAALSPLFFAGVLATAVVFGLGHGLLVAMPVFIAFGAALGWVRLRSDSVWPGVVAHGLFNALALIAVYADLQQ